MGRAMQGAAKRPRLSLDVDGELRRRLRLAAAKRDVSVGRYVIDTLEARLREDLGEDDDAVGLSAKTDPVLADLWDNTRDAEYERLPPR